MFDLRELIAGRRRFPTIYADPPWRYRNESSRAAAVNHYATLSLKEIWFRQRMRGVAVSVGRLFFLADE